MRSNQTVIGALHVPVNTILAAPPEWQRALGTPRPGAATASGEAGRSDWDVVDELAAFQDRNAGTAMDGDADGCLTKVKELSFYSFLEDRMFAEAAIYAKNGVRAFILENVAAPYFARGRQPAAIYWAMRALAARLREEYPAGDYEIGVQILAFSDDWAMDIACRAGLDFIRCESALFEGIRPEGRTPNAGNLARLYWRRQRWLHDYPETPVVPRVYVDLQKKHTVFIDELADLETWLSNIVFMKLEGVVVTGTGTGQPVQETDYSAARRAIDAVKALPYFPGDLELPLLAGSGVSVDNIELCKRYVDKVIVGSSLKEHGYWECPLSADRVARFMEAWNR